jgi:aminoglycoside phosphotransferase (APT) family kinase protein
VAATLDLADGRTVFAKITGRPFNADTPDIYRREARIMAALPAGVPAPRLLHVLDTGDWVGLVLEFIAGKLPDQPWNRNELDRVLQAVWELATTLTPAPVTAPRLIDEWADEMRGFRTHRERPDQVARVSDWAAANLTRLADLEAGWQDVADGETLIHFDLRADNILLTETRVVFVDWPHVCLGAPWVDLLFMLPSVLISAAVDPDQIIAEHPLTAQVPRSHLDSVLAAIAGFFTARSLEPPPRGMPTVRRFQQDQAQAALVWLERRLAVRDATVTGFLGSADAAVQADVRPGPSNRLW